MLHRGIRRRFSYLSALQYAIVRDSLGPWLPFNQKISEFSLLPKATLFTCTQRNYRSEGTLSRGPCECSLVKTFLLQRSSVFVPYILHLSWRHVRYMSNSSIELTADKDVVKFSIGGRPENTENSKLGRQVPCRIKMSKTAKVNELRLYRLKAKKKMNSPNPEVRIKYKLEKAKRKEEWLIEKLRKYEVPEAPAETYDPEILTEEEKFYLKRTGEKKKHYVPVGRRGVFGGVVLNMHLHWKKHETVKVICKPCKPGQVHKYADELARLSKCIVIDVKPNNTILFYRGKNYVQPEIMSPPATLSKVKRMRISLVRELLGLPGYVVDSAVSQLLRAEQKALEKYRHEQSLEHTSQFIEKLEKELDEYHKYKAQFSERKEMHSMIQ